MANQTHIQMENKFHLQNSSSFIEFDSELQQRYILP